MVDDSLPDSHLDADAERPLDIPALLARMRPHWSAYRRAGGQPFWFE